MTDPDRPHEHLADTLAEARRAVLVRRPLHWRVASALIAHLEAARGELERRDELAPWIAAPREPGRRD